MRRPIGVTIIAVLFLAAAVYLWIAAAMLLVAPGSILPFTGNVLRRALRLTGPYAGLGIGICYALVGWALFRLHNWARVVAMLILGVGAAVMLPSLGPAATGFRTSAILVGVQIVLRFVATLYLLGPKIIDTFVPQH